MKKLLGYSLLTAACIMLSGCAAAHAQDNKPTQGYINENITVKSGYYTCEEDDSYIHVDGNMIERCNVDYYADAENAWNRYLEEFDEEERGKQAEYHDTYVENTAAWAMEFDELQEFVVYTYPLSTFYPEKSDDTTLVLNYESLQESGSYTGYGYNEDGSIERNGHNYYYVGEELPV